MICNYCQSEQSKDHIFCTDCGESFYLVEITQQVIYKTSERLILPIAALNRGSDPFAIEKVKINEGLIKKFDIEDKRNIIQKGDKKDFKIDLDTNTVPTQCFLDIQGKIRGEEINITPRNNKIYILEVPRLKTPKEYEVDPISGYTIDVEIELENQSILELEEISLWEGTRRINCKTLNRKLDINNRVERIHVDLPVQKKGEKIFELRIKKKWLPDEVIQVKVRYRSLPQFKISRYEWTEEGFKPIDITALNQFDWNVPQNKPLLKLIRLESTIPDENSVDYLKVKLFVNPPINFLDKTQIKTFDLHGPYDEYLAITETHEEAHPELGVEIVDRTKSEGKIEKKWVINLKNFEPKPYPYYVGLDFGTSNSCISLVLPNKQGKIDVSTRINRPLPIEWFNKEELENYDVFIMPSLIGAVDEQNFIFGYQAKRRKGIPLSKEVKKDVRENKPDRDFYNKTPVQIVSLIIKEIIKRATEYLYDMSVNSSSLQNITVTVPTTFIPAWRNRIREACEKALGELGVPISSVNLVDEASASIRYYIEMQKGNIKPGLIMLYDFGGGTTDVVVIKAEKVDYTMRYITFATGGNPNLGGRHIDEQIFKVLIPSEKQEEWENEKDLIELLKINLWDKNKAMGDMHSWLKIEKSKCDKKYEEVLEAIRTKLETSICMVLEDILEQLKFRLSGTEAKEKLPLLVLLSGNSSKLFKFKEILSYVLSNLISSNNELKKIIDFKEQNVKPLDEPKYCVSIGAFLESALGAKTVIENISTFDILVWIPGEVSHPSVLKIEGKNYYPLLKRGEIIPTKKEFKLSEFGISDSARRDTLSFHLHSRFGGGSPEFENTITLKKPRNQKGKLVFKIDDKGEKDLIWK